MTGFKSLSDIEALEETPLTAQDLPDSTYQLLQRGAAINPDNIALHFFLQGTAFDKPVSFTYQQLLHHINQTANLFGDLGIGKNDVVSMVLPNLPQTHFTIWGGEAAGIVNPINPLLEAQEMANIMNAAGTKVLVTLAPFPKIDIWQKIAAIANQIPTLETIIQVRMENMLPFFTRMAVKLMARRIQTDPVQANIIDFDHSIARYPGDQLRSGRVIQPTDIASYFHTGGTTGTPKLAQHTHANEVADSFFALQTLPVDSNTVMFCGLPLFHVNAVIVTGSIPFSQGSTVVLGTPAGYRGEGVIPNFWKIVDHYGVNYFSGVPTVYSTLLNVPVAESDISSLKFAVCGAAPMPVEVFKSFEARTGLRILEGYGLTEGTCISSVNPAFGERRVGSIGLRLPYQAMKTVCLNAAGKYQRDCEPDEIGVVAVRGANVFPGYKHQADNRGLWLETGDGGEPWLNTGDLGRMDADGYFWLTGRRKELIIRGGHNIDPNLIEAPLHRHPAVALAAAVGRPDAHAGELPVAYVELKAGASATADELLAYAKENIGERAAIPKKLEIIETMPQTTVGKIYKPALVYREIAAVYQAEVNAIPGVTAVEVNVGSNKTYGTLARLNITPAADTDLDTLKSAIEQVLGKYTIQFELHGL